MRGDGTHSPRVCSGLSQYGAVEAASPLTRCEMTPEKTRGKKLLRAVAHGHVPMMYSRARNILT